MNEIAVREVAGQLEQFDSPAGDLIAWARAASQAYEIAVRLAETSFVPKVMQRRPDEITGAILTGRELGLNPMSALRSIDIIDGTPSMRAHALRGLVQSHGHRVWVEETNNTRAIVCGQRKQQFSPFGGGAEPIERRTWTLDDARRAGLANKNVWQKYPAAMLIARATAEVCRAIAADVLLGMPYATEELTDGVEGAVVPIETGPDGPRPARKPAAKRTAQRAAPPADPAETEPPLDPLDEPDEPKSVADDNREPQVDTGGADPDTDEPMITAAQSRKLHAAYRDAGIEARESRLSLASGLIGRALSSSSELTKREASLVIDAVESGYGRQDDDQPEPDEPPRVVDVDPGTLL